MTVLPAPFGTREEHRWVEDWANYGLCGNDDPDALFVQGKEQRTAKSICRTCPVIAECLAEALDNRTEFGVWGGMTERERRALLRSRPGVRSWAAIFARALDDGAEAARLA